MTGDGAARNYAISEKSLFCFDTECQFVEPVIKPSILSSNIMQFKNILFCLKQANQPLDHFSLKQFCELKNIYSRISAWINLISEYGKNYSSLFTPDEIKTFYESSSEERFTPYFLLREGALGTFYIQLNYLQNYLRNVLHNQCLPSALDLLEVINARVGFYYRKAYDANNTPEKRWMAALGVPQASLSSSLALKASLGIVPTLAELQKQPKFTLAGAKHEMLALLNFKPDFSKLIDERGQPDLSRQLMLLKALALYPHTELDISHCLVLTDKLLRNILAKSPRLESISLRSCPRITKKSIIYLATRHGSTLKTLKITDLTNLTEIDDGSVFIKGWLFFPQLEMFHASRCKLKSVLLESPDLWAGTDTKSGGDLLLIATDKQLNNKLEKNKDDKSGKNKNSN
ncbi:MAG: hypothetical protein ACK4PR_13700, partial [Gammaproteobacteria bacterium]